LGTARNQILVAISIAIVGVAAALTATPALAHHSFAMFDQAKKVTVQGTV
jgi:Family of unknown function (DUF6152)